MTAIALVIAIFEEKFEWIERLARGRKWAYATLAIALIFCIELFGVIDKTVPFVYFQF